MTADDPLPEWMADQLRSATGETWGMLDPALALAQRADPGRDWTAYGPALVAGDVCGTCAEVLMPQRGEVASWMSRPTSTPGGHRPSGVAMTLSRRRGHGACARLECRGTARGSPGRAGPLGRYVCPSRTGVELAVRIAAVARAMLGGSVEPTAGAVAL